MDKLVESVERQRTECRDIRGCVQDAVAEKLREDNLEAENVRKRRCNVMIHGLGEAESEDAETRKKYDEDIVTEILHVMKCDDVSVDSAVRFGKYELDKGGNRRPMRLVAASEQQKDKILRMAKNLRRHAEYKNVYIHQDLTPKQREKRRQLVEEMKLRKQKGEEDLIIVGDRIMQRKP